MAAAIGYLRVSTREQGRSGLGLAAQRFEIEAFGVREGFSVRSWYQDVQTGGGLRRLQRRTRQQGTADLNSRRTLAPERICTRSIIPAAEGSFLGPYLATFGSLTRPLVPSMPIGSLAAGVASSASTSFSLRVCVDVSIGLGACRLRSGVCNSIAVFG
jgi:hypothetical protein